MSRVKGKKSDFKKLNRGKVAGKTKGTETPPLPSTRVDPWENARDHDTPETCQDLNPGQAAQDDDVKDTRQDIAPSETAQDATVNDPGRIDQDKKISRETLLSWVGK